MRWKKSRKDCCTTIKKEKVNMYKMQAVWGSLRQNKKTENNIRSPVKNPVTL